MITFGWIRSLFLRFRRSSDPAVEIIQPQPSEPSKPSALEQEIYRWVDQTVREAWSAIDAKSDSLFDNLFFKQRAELGRVELWLSACRSGCCCEEGMPETSILISSLEVSWEDSRIPIQNSLTAINRNRKHPFYHRILIASYPGLPSLDVDRRFAQTVILWKIRPFSENLIVGLPTEPRVNQDASILQARDVSIEEDFPSSKHLCLVKP